MQLKEADLIKETVNNYVSAQVRNDITCYLMITFAQVVRTSTTVTDNIPLQEHSQATRNPPLTFGEVRCAKLWVWAHEKLT